MDDRLTVICAYCGEAPDTRDHVPSKVLLDEPFPPGLPVVGACSKCNHDFSLDEQYLACFVECVTCGTCEIEDLRRPKIKRILSKNPSLRARIVASQSRDEEGYSTWKPEMDRVLNVLIKLAHGHIAYEFVPMFDEPDHVIAAPLTCMPDDERKEFENGVPRGRMVFSEIGTRGFLREVGSKLGHFEQEGDWIVVQSDRYRYTAKQCEGGFLVRMVLSEYLAGIVAWES
ncbi:hypothetical protein [Methanoculleus sediminis]|nr:hypothetical protein [Methanoculleus sediminis]